METRQTRQLLEKISDIVALLNTSTDLHQFLAAVQKHLASFIYAENCYLALIDPKGKYISFPFYLDVHDDFTLDQLEAIPLEQLFRTLTFYAMKQKKVCVMTSGDIEMLVERRLIKTLGTIPKQWLCFPLSHKEQFLGVFVIQSYRRSDEYSALMVDMLTAISQVLAAALVAFKTHAELSHAHQLMANHKNELEHQVNERTHSLFQTVQELKHEVARNQALQQELRYKAQHDALTGLFNREHLNELLRQEQHGFSYCAFVDLDGFKAINDSHGHRTGDLLLIEVAKRLRQICVDGDIAIPNGGDEFILLFCTEQLVEVEKRLQQTLEAIRQIKQINDCAVQIGASIGVAVGHKEQALHQMLNKADGAMYQAKLAGKQRLHIDHEHYRLN